MSAGKGSKPRPYNPAAFAAGWERVFGKKQEPVRYTGHVPCKRCGKTHWMYAECAAEYARREGSSKTPEERAALEAAFMERLEADPVDESDPLPTWRCPECGSEKDPWFSRTEPMGYFCPDCGKEAI